MYCGRYVVDYPGAIEKFEYPRHESTKHLILQHNKSWCTTYSVIVDTVITNQTLGNQVVKLVRL